ncbi:MAG: type 2 isopentenyl-diphosphate Delta-isomerase [Candidatus Caldarchaeum sp.]|nr:type 2 isopentenyl-diphosphate Delta-isomerase [Candidatus Caldarchaeum sp.]MCX8201531.1 type 2 isopentenyl-diphosphate Delta-isomerase [Candidatus Caldarchaeum sp.]MDW8062803.1 type 2 isopentenyl-diphosphate Delta-isomerase [Candidatus Caldarchaeum sp.]MDW8435178.1 type 2 isopentenyl-diphosphate Delta-isomerase [Candidatus Caldarchaeum sp.]
MGIEARKTDHIKLSLERDVSYKKTTWLEYVELVHVAAPEVDPEDVDTEVEFLGRRFSHPFVIESMTGGTSLAEKINASLGEAAARFKIPMGVGSQRAGIVKPETAQTFRTARDHGPDAFLIGNIGAAQLIENGVAFAQKAVKMIDADALAIHLNPLQEIVQPDGKARFRNFYTVLRRLKEEIAVPIILKEIGCGLSREVVETASEAGVDAFDVAGSGGTNWTLIEMMRADEVGASEKKSLAEVFLEWGIPTAAAVVEAVDATSRPVIASGGLRTGLDSAKALALGASMTGLARPFLEPATKSADEVLKVLNALSAQLRTAMFLTGSKNVGELKHAPKVVLGPLKEWISQRATRGSRQK